MALDLKNDMDEKFLKSGFEEDIEFAYDGTNYAAIKAVVDRAGTFSGAKPPAGQIPGSIRHKEMKITVSDSDVPNVLKNKSKAKVKKYTEDAAYSIFLISGIITHDAGAFVLELT